MKEEDNKAKDNNEGISEIVIHTMDELADVVNNAKEPAIIHVRVEQYGEKVQTE